MSEFKLGKNQQAFLAALRSGEFEQTNYRLEDEHGYCCLGVGCVIAERHGVEVRRSGLGLVKGDSLSNQPAVQEWLGLYNPYGDSLLRDPGYMPALTRLNDTLGRTFNEIADHLEANAKYYFKESK